MCRAICSVSPLSLFGATQILLAFVYQKVWPVFSWIARQVILPTRQSKQRANLRKNHCYFLFKLELGFLFPRHLSFFSDLLSLSLLGPVFSFQSIMIKTIPYHNINLMPALPLFSRKVGGSLSLCRKDTAGFPSSINAFSMQCYLFLASQDALIVM